MMKKLGLLAVTLMLTTHSTFADVTSLKVKLQQQYPALKIENLQKTEMPGLYSATFEDQVVYLDESGQYLLAGSMIRLKDQKNLTRDLVLQQNQVDWKSLPLKNAIKTVRGTGKRQLAVFSDPNCPYCKRLEAELAKLTDVTIYTFIYPLKPQSMMVSKQVWCDKNPSQAWSNLLQKNITPSASASCSTPLEQNLKLGERLGVEGTPTLILSNGFKLTGAYPAEQIEQIWKEFNL